MAGGLQQAVVERRRAYGRFRRHRTAFYRDEYKRAMARARKVLQEAKGTFLASYDSTLINAQTP